MSAKINIVAAPQASQLAIVARTPKMSAQINTATIPSESAAKNDEQAAPSNPIGTHSHAASLNPTKIDEQAAALNPAASTILEAEEAAIATLSLPSELVAVQAILDVYKPQRLRQIFASVCYLLTYNTDPRDYYFIVDPIDRPILTGRGIKKFERLINTSTNSTIRIGFITETGEMTIMTMPYFLDLALRGELIHWVRKNIAGVHGLTLWYPDDDELLGGPQYVCTVNSHGKPYAVFLLANSGKQADADEVVRSMLPVITRDYPSIKMVVQLQLRGLDTGTHTRDADIKAQDVAGKSCIEVWAHNGVKLEKGHPSSAGDLKDGEFRLHLLGEGAEDKTVPVFQFSDILDIIREHCKQGVPLSAHPRNEDPRAPNNNKGLQASAFPLNALKSRFTAITTKFPGPRVVENKPFSSLSGGALATRRGMLPTGTAGLGPIKAGGNGRRIHGTARNTLGSLFPARHLVGRLVRR
ncbi:hypothetical protein B0H67DRAFT_614341 [Lasiosphaeris hirsuta]|uniref:Uncharacterized protein n=1 Tax=Lasiosphaeris hirsuta TaxID=260670 RepID=A0AA40DHQ9_9PEZI|nr:hypothetical protein B0H67DRAFT_614341 [Lasiosphaeris hirsuta]